MIWITIWIQNKILIFKCPIFNVLSILILIVFIALNIHLKTDSRCTKQKKQKTLIINLRHCRGEGYNEILGKAEIGVDMLVQRDTV